ncbi:energy-coupling factor transporter transmembrane component T family protein [Sulfitobacter geojensis]|uniref:energy-coupling factor transporter transmembrane component T family protein n=1 Tax=Sulfitobacter geojensis TaxID=1342299 RepID=UPI0036D7CF56
MISLTSPVKTAAHYWPAGTKMAGLCVATFVLFFIQSLALHLFILAVVIGAYALPGPVFFYAGLRLLRILWPYIAIVMIWHLWIGNPDDGLRITLRMVSAVALANLVTMSTKLSDMIGVVDFVTAPLRRFGLNPKVLALSIALVIRMTPVLLEKGGLLVQSWRARSKSNSSWRIILPFTLLALDDADHIAEALRARGGFITHRDD